MSILSAFAMPFAAFRQFFDSASKNLPDKPADLNKPTGDTLKEIESSPVKIRPDSMEAYAEVVMSVFNRLQLPSNPDKTEPKRLTWIKQKGSAKVIIEIENNDTAPDIDDREITLQITAPLVKLPTASVKSDENLFNLFHLLLDLNNHLSDCRLALCEEYGVVLVVKRRALGLDQVEFTHMLKVISHKADKFDNLLSRDFKLPMWGSDNELNF